MITSACLVNLLSGNLLYSPLYQSEQHRSWHYDAIFRVTGPLWGESTGYRWIPLTMSSDAELRCFLWTAPFLIAKTGPMCNQCGLLLINWKVNLRNIIISFIFLNDIVETTSYLLSSIEDDGVVFVSSDFCRRHLENPGHITLQAGLLVYNTGQQVVTNLQETWWRHQMETYSA